MGPDRVTQFDSHRTPPAAPDQDKLRRTDIGYHHAFNLPRFRPAWWLPGPHAQTIFPFLARRYPLPTLHHERLELDDGDFLDLYRTAPVSGPLVIILPGLGGTLESHYLRRLLSCLVELGAEALVMLYRGDGPEPNRFAKSYHAGQTEDVSAVVSRAQSISQSRPIVAVGYSMGANLLLKWLGENDPAGPHPITTAAAVSVPFDLSAGSRRVETGLSRGYGRYLLNAVRRNIRRKYFIPELAPQLPINRSVFERLRTLRQFDEQVTAPLHGFSGAEDYYAHASCKSFLNTVTTPTLILHSLDDPFIPTAAIPLVEELGTGLHLYTYPHGGHVGFVEGIVPLKGQYWAESQLLRWISHQVEPLGG